MEGDTPLYAGAPRQDAGLAGCQVTLAGGDLRILLKEGRLDEQVIGAPRELDDLPGVLRSVGHIGDIGDLLPRRGPGNTFL